MSSHSAAGLLRSRALLGTLVVQGLGSAATLLVGLLIAWFQGPEAQGHYGVLRATADLCLAIGLLGLPQSIVHLIQYEGVRPAALYACLRRYSLALLVLAVVLVSSIYFGWMPARISSSIQGSVAALAMAITVLGWIVQGMLRSFVLCLGSTRAFSWVTAAPSLTLLCCAMALMAAGSQRYEWALAGSGLLSVAWGTLAVRPLQAMVRWREGGDVRISSFVDAGGHAAVQVVMVTAQPFIALWFMQRGEATAAEIGWLVLAGYIQQAFVLPASFAMPLVYARASNARGMETVTNLWRGIWVVGPFACVCAMAAAVVLPSLLTTIAKGAYAGALHACLWLVAAGPAAMMGRLAAVMLLGQGRFSLVSTIYSLRVAAMTILIPAWMWLGASGIAAGAAAGWAIAEMGAAAWLLTAGHLSRQRKEN